MATAADHSLLLEPSHEARRARFALALFVAVAGLLVAVTLSPWASGFADAPDRGPGDVALYRAELERIRSGAGYYDAAAAELSARGYPTQSLFNWRTPLPVWLVAKLPELRAAHVLLGGLGLALVVLAFKLLADEGTVQQGFVGVVLLSGAILPCILGDLVLMSELWSGVLVALSAVLFGVKRPLAGVVAGIAALFFRELAAPYVVVCLALATCERRYRELALWGFGLAAYAVFYGLHAGAVLPRIPPEAPAHQDGWIRFGGAAFLLSTAQMNAYLLLVPQWVTALYLACALLGAAAWNTPAGRRIGISVAVYAVAFSIAGHDFNQYWGCQIAPLLCLSVARSGSVLGDLWRRSRQASGR